jgi:hypothetical protein
MSFCYLSFSSEVGFRTKAITLFHALSRECDLGAQWDAVFLELQILPKLAFPYAYMERQRE